MSTKSKTISVRVTEDMYNFFDNWCKMMGKETGIDIPMGAIITKVLKGFIAHFEYMHGGDGKGSGQCCADGESMQEHMKNHMERLVEEYKNLLKEESKS